MANTAPITVTNGSIVVTGNLTQFVAAPGDLLVVQGISAVIAERVDSATLRLRDPWAQVTVTDTLEWEIVPTADYWNSVVEIHRKISNLIQMLEGGLPLKPDAAGTLPERDAFNDQPEGFLYLQTDVNPFLLYVKTGPGPTNWSVGQRLQADQAESTLRAMEAEANARASEEAAALSEANAAGSEAAAATSAGQALASQQAALTSEQNADASEASALQHRNDAQSARDDAQAAQSGAETARTGAEAARDVATGARDTALGARDAAIDARDIATGAATAAAASAGAASTSETNAAASATSALNALDWIDDHFLGTKEADPTTDNDGNPIIVGAQYFNSMSNTLRFKTSGGPWASFIVDAPEDGDTYGRKNGAWVKAAGAAQIQDTPPETGDVGTFWWSSLTGQLAIRYNDGDTTQWVGLNGSLAATVWTSDNPPDTPFPGMLWWQSSTGELSIRYNDGDSEQWTTVAGGSVAFPAFRGARAARNLVWTVASGSLVTLAFNNTVFSTDGIHNVAGQSSRLTVPPGVSYVELTGFVQWAINNTGVRYVDIIKNGNGGALMISDRKVPVPSDYTEQSVTTGPLAVVPGDYFEFRVYQTSGSNVDVRVGAQFTMKVLG